MTVLEIPAAEYHADSVGVDRPCLSASIAKLLTTRSPAHAWHAHPKLNPAWQRTVDDKFDLGTAVHDLLLGDASGIQVLDFPDWRTNAAKEARAEARDGGWTPVLRAQWEQISPVVDAIRAQLEEHDAYPVPFTEGRAEQTIVWEETDGVMCKARLDWLRDDREAVDDLKTTTASASPEQWLRTMYGFGGEIQVAFYLRGCRANGFDTDFRFVAVELEPPHLLSVVSLPPDAMAIGEDKVDWAIRKWGECLRTGEWPGYTKQVAWAEPPAWLETQWLERREMLT